MLPGFVATLMVGRVSPRARAAIAALMLQPAEWLFPTG